MQREFGEIVFKVQVDCGMGHFIVYEKSLHGVDQALETGLLG